MKLNAFIGDERHELTLEGAQPVEAFVDGRGYNLTATELSSGGLLLMHGSETFDCHVTPTNAGAAFEVHLRGTSYLIRLEDPKRLRSGQVAGGHDHGAVKIVAPMPGKVVRVMVELGQSVAAGAGIIVVEAMKMQNEMKAPKAGTVVKLHAADGATVNVGDVLAVIE